MDEERGMIKWAPFASVIDSNILVNEILEEKEKINKPILTDDRYINIEDDILYSYKNNEYINIEYFKNGKICKIKEKVYKIDTFSKQIILSNKTKLNFNIIINTYL